MNKKLLVICGPTSTGKTELALKLAKEFDGELVSADSRQVYKGMDIGTGKDLPVGSSFVANRSSVNGFYIVDGIKIWGLDLVEPKEEFSVSQFIEFAQKVLEDIWSSGKTPILVGGTGFYVKALVDGIDTLEVPKDSGLRLVIGDWDAEKLYGHLLQLDPVKAEGMNDSDRKNPARLVRAIEVAEWRKMNYELRSMDYGKNKNLKSFDTLFIGLELSKDLLSKRIEERVEKRVRQGVEDEIRRLLASGVTWDMQSMNTLGYKEWREYFENQLTAGPAARQPQIHPQRVTPALGLPDLASPAVLELQHNWVQNEKNYAKRQMTWFKKDKRIKWFDVSEDSYESIEKLVRTWHTKNNA